MESLKRLTLLAACFAVATLAAEQQTFNCTNLEKTCSCALLVQSGSFQINCPLADSNTADINYVPEKKMEITCKNTVVSEDAYLTFGEHYMEVTEPLTSLKIPESLRGVKVENFVIRDCIVSNSTLDDFGLVGLKKLEISGNGSFSRGVLTKDFFSAIAADLNMLSINDVGLEAIDGNVFEGMLNLNSLYIFKNILEDIGEQFRSLKNLKKLDLSRNKIKRVSESAFVGLDQLELLHLFDNEIESLPPDIFKGLSKIISLDLSLNNLTELPGNLLDGLFNLKTFSAMKNQLQTLPETLFKNNPKLNRVRFSSNRLLTTLPDELFANLNELTHVQLEYCALQNLPSNLFKNSPKIKILHIHKNNLTEIPAELLTGLNNLDELQLNHNQISSLSNSPFKSLSSLNTLHLNNNLLTKIDAISLNGLSSLAYLHLSDNSIENISLVYMRNLKRVDLANNKIRLENFNIYQSPFNGCENLEEINLSGNLVGSVFIDFSLVNLRQLDLSRNEIESLSYKDFQTASGHRIHMNLKDNRITFIDMKNADILANSAMNTLNSTVDLDGNPLVCDCNSYDLLRFLKHDMGPEIEKRLTLNVDNLFCSGPLDFAGRKVKNLDVEEVHCAASECTEGCECTWRPHMNTLMVDCSYMKLKSVPVIDVKGSYERLEVNLKGNALVEAPRTGEGYDNVTVLDLSENSISDVKWIPNNAEVINLDHNNITRLSYEVLSKLNATTLHNNPWTCDCAARNLSNFVNRNKLIHKEHIRCKGTNRLLGSMLEKELCPTSEILYASIGILAAFIITIPSVIFALYYKYNNEIKVWLFAHNLFLWFVTEEDLDKDKIYDAFISYSHKDEDFVHDELLPKLEDGPDPYKICIHVRNFIPGEFIATQVMDSVKSSRRTIVVLSPDFLESVWGKMEFKLAHTQAITDGVTRVIVILLGDVEDNPKMDDELRAYLKTNTYIKWGDPWFWDRLRYALPHQRMPGAKKNEKLQNIVIKIDEMDLINGNTTPNCATSTPPAHPLLLKSHPLEFKPADGERNTPPAEAGI